MNINQLVENYRQLMISSWPQLQPIVGQVKDHPYFIDDWLQANWELMVELPLGGNTVLLPYGYDSNTGPWYAQRERVPTHRLLCVDGNQQQYHFLHFVVALGDNFKIEPPFTDVHVSNHMGLFNLAVKDVTFVLEAY